MASDLLGIVRLQETAVRFFRPPVSPDFAWVALPDLMAASGFDRCDDLPAAHAILEGETRIARDDGENVEIVPHVIGMGIAAAGMIQRGLPVDEAYSTANAEVTKVMFIGMSEEERQSFIRIALAYNQRLIEFEPGTPRKAHARDIAKQVKRIFRAMKARWQQMK